MEKMKIVPTSIKLERELHEKIKADAIKSDRSFTKQITYIIKKYYELKDEK